MKARIARHIETRTTTIIWTPTCRIDLFRLDGKIWVRVTLPMREFGFAIDLKEQTSG